MTMVAKMKLIYTPTITNKGRTIMCISSPRIKWVGKQRRENVGFPAAVAVGFFGHN